MPFIERFEEENLVNYSGIPLEQVKEILKSNIMTNKDIESATFQELKREILIINHGSSYPDDDYVFYSQIQ